MEVPAFKLFLDTRNSEQTGEAILSLGAEPGGDIIAKLPYKTPLDTIRARMFLLLPECFDQIEGFRQLWFYEGPMTFECPICKTKSKIMGASDAQVGRLERLRMKLLA